jgi:hypothetical protein
MRLLCVSSAALARLSNKGEGDPALLLPVPGAKTISVAVEGAASKLAPAMADWIKCLRPMIMTMR